MYCYIIPYYRYILCTICLIYYFTGADLLQCASNQDVLYFLPEYESNDSMYSTQQAQRQEIMQQQNLYQQLDNHPYDDFRLYSSGSNITEDMQVGASPVPTHFTSTTGSTTFADPTRYWNN